VRRSSWSWLTSHRDVVLRLAGNTSRHGASPSTAGVHANTNTHAHTHTHTRTHTRAHTHTHTHTHTLLTDKLFIFILVRHTREQDYHVSSEGSEQTAAHCARYAPCGMATLPLKDMCQQHQLISHPWQWYYYADSSDDHVYRRMQSRSRPALRLATTSHLHPATAYRMSPVARTRFNAWS
jgi:hypothetical protein